MHFFCRTLLGVSQDLHLCRPLYPAFSFKSVKTELRTHIQRQEDVKSGVLDLSRPVKEWLWGWFALWPDIIIESASRGSICKCKRGTIRIGSQNKKELIMFLILFVFSNQIHRQAISITALDFDENSQRYRQCGSAASSQWWRANFWAFSSFDKPFPT